MPKKIVKKKITKRKPSIQKPVSGSSTEKILVDNFVSLQKVMTNLAVKFDNLSTQLSKLLDLFEISAKALAEKDFDLGKERKDSKKMLEKLDTLTEQNKIIARGLTLMHDKIPHQEELGGEEQPLPQKQMPKPPAFKKTQDISGGYQKSISSKPQGFKKLPQPRKE